RRPYIATQQLVELFFLRGERVDVRQVRELFLRETELHVHRVRLERDFLGDVRADRAIELLVERDGFFAGRERALALEDGEVLLRDRVHDRLLLLAGVLTLDVARGGGVVDPQVDPDQLRDRLGDLRRDEGVRLLRRLHI